MRCARRGKKTKPTEVHNNYYFLRQLVPELKEKLRGWELAACFSQVKDELILGFLSGTEEFYIRAYLQPDFSCLSFPQSFARAHKNTADLFPALIGKAVDDIVQFKNERSFAIKFQDNLALLFKMYGNRANLILYQNEAGLALFKNTLLQDLNIEWDTLDRSIPQDKDAFWHNQGDVQKTFPTFGKIPKKYLYDRNYETLSLEMKWDLITRVKQQIELPERFYITRIDSVPTLSLLKVGEVFFETDDPVEAINYFFTAYTRDYYFEKEKQRSLKQLESAIASAEAYLEKTREKLTEIQERMGYDQLANIIMANLHQIPANVAETTLYDFYHDSPITIKLNPKLSPQKNAENFYRKSKNQRIEIENLQKNIRAKEEKKRLLAQHIFEVEKISVLKTLRKYLKAHSLSQSKAGIVPTSPFKVFEVDGFQILIGKNAKNNDLLTQKYAFKEDLWLHAKDVAGSHVVIKYQAGKKFPKPIIQKAAQLAAYYSQRKTDSLCPVIFTPKKFVRKPKGASPGAVVVEKEEVILVQPASPKAQ